MKKITLLIASFFCLTSFGQGKVAEKVSQLISQNVNFKHFSVLDQDNSIANKETDKVVETATFAKIKNSIVNDIVQNKYEYLEIEIPYQNASIEVQLYKVTIFAEDFQLDTDKSKNIAYEPGVYYRGIVKNDMNSLVSFNFFKDELNAIISNRIYSNLVIGKLDKKNNTTDYIIYSDAEMKVFNDFKCGTKDIPSTGETLNKNTQSPESTKCVTMYFEIDNDIYNSNNSSTTTTTNWMTSLFNNLQTLYNNDGISISLKSTYIWTTLDPYDGIGTSSSDYLYKFNEVRPVFNGDVGQLLGIDGGGLGGVAIGTNGICTESNFSYSDVNISYNTVPTYSWTVNVIAHEYGHLLGSPHTHGCHWNGDDTAIDGCGQSQGYTEGNCDEAEIPESGTIMSYCHLLSWVGVNLSNGFGPQPTALILSKVNGGDCLSTDCVNTCINTVSAVNIGTVTNNSATISWTEAGSATNWQVAIYPFTSTPTSWSTVTTPSFSQSGLAANTYYVAAVRPNCTNGLTGSSRKIMFATGANYCSSIVFYDTGGANGNYEDYQTIYRTMIPNVANNKVKLTFNEFSLELDYDYIYVYNGSSTASPSFNVDGYTGTTIPGPFTSTAANGALTMKFYSDGGVVDSGWKATTSCIPNLATSEFDGIDFTYAPNPTNGIVTITSKDNVSELAVYSITGQLLLEQKPNQNNLNVNLASFANGTYFFKLKFEDKEVNFRIVKQ